MQSDAGVTVDDEQIEVVEHVKYLGSLKADDGNCSKDTRSRIAMAKKRMLDLGPMWKDRGITKELKMKLVGPSLGCVESSHLWHRWTPNKADEKRIESAELWIYRRMLRVSWTEHRTDESMFTELNTTRQLLGFVVGGPTSQTLLLWTHNQRRRMRAGEVRDPGESERGAKAWKTKEVIQQSDHRMDVK